MEYNLAIPCSECVRFGARCTFPAIRRTDRASCCRCRRLHRRCEIPQQSIVEHHELMRIFAFRRFDTASQRVTAAYAVLAAAIAEKDLWASTVLSFPSTDRITLLDVMGLSAHGFDPRSLHLEGAIGGSCSCIRFVH